MSGHSKWKNIMHKKEKTDAKSDKSDKKKDKCVYKDRKGDLNSR